MFARIYTCSLPMQLDRKSVEGNGARVEGM